MAKVIHERIEEDKYGNDVSIIYLTSGRRLRMVHHTPSGRERQRCTIFAGKGKSIKYTGYFPAVGDPVIEVGPYRVRWHNHHTQVETMNALAPVIDDKFEVSEDSDSVLFHALDAIEEIDDLWSFKEVK